MIALTIASSRVPSERLETNERSIFKRVDGEVLEIAERGVAHAEIVDRYPYPQLA